MVSKTIGAKVSLEEYTIFKQLIEEDNQHAREVGDLRDLTVAKAIREFVKWNVRNAQYVASGELDELCDQMGQEIERLERKLEVIKQEHNKLNLDDVLR